MLAEPQNLPAESLDDKAIDSALYIRITPMFVAICITVLVIERLWFAALRTLSQDEALYWVWSRHLALGYLDHPPMIAYLIRLSTALLGQTELGVRIFGVLMSLGAGAIVMRIVHRLTHDARATYLAGIMLLLNPLILFLGAIFAPDTPACFFSIAALACLVTVKNSEQPISPTRWILFGLFTGAAVLSKYTAAVPAIAVPIALLMSSVGRAELRRPWPYIAIAIALLVFSPVIYWNATHDWVSFRFQFNHGTESARDNPLPLLTYLGGQALAFTPVLFIMGIIVIFWNGRHIAQISRSRQLLLWSATLPLVLFGIISLRSRGELNWPDFAYFPLSALIACYVSQSWTGSRRRWALIACFVAATFTVVMQVPELLWKLHVPLARKMDEVVQWDDLAEEISGIRGDLPAVASRYQDAAEVTFYDPKHSEVWQVNLGGRPTAYDYLSRKPDVDKYDRLVFIGGHAEEFAKTRGFDIEKSQEAQTMLPDGRTRERTVTIMRRHEIP
jgi:4-amino-4-deoxy-L-arabinose transferase-like glycosyltransferase